MNLLIDTSVLVEWERGRYDLPGLASRAETIWICDAGVTEFLAGQPVKDEGKRQRWRTFWRKVAALPSLPLSRAVCERAGELLGLARARGRTVPMGDALHAGVADLHDLTVATLDPAHFKAMGVPTWQPSQPASGRTAV